MSKKKPGALDWSRRCPKTPGLYLCDYQWRTLLLRVSREGGDLLVRNHYHMNGDTFGMMLVNESKRDMWWLGPLPHLPY